MKFLCRFIKKRRVVFKAHYITSSGAAVDTGPSGERPQPKLRGGTHELHFDALHPPCWSLLLSFCKFQPRRWLPHFNPHEAQIYYCHSHSPKGSTYFSVVNGYSNKSLPLSYFSFFYFGLLLPGPKLSSRFSLSYIILYIFTYKFLEIHVW